MELRAGSRLRSAVDETEVVVVRAPKDDVELWCGGHPMVPLDQSPPGGAGPEAGHDGGTALGKRYADDEAGLEVLCTKPGNGSLSLAGARLAVKEAKPLPSSD